MRDWVMVRCKSEGSACSDAKAFLLSVPAIGLMIAAFWSVHLF